MSYLLSQLWEVNPALVIPEVANQLTNFLASNPSSEKRSGVISIIRNAVDTNPQLATPPLFGTLWAIVEDKKATIDVRTAALDASAAILKNNREIPLTGVLEQLDLLFAHKKADLQSSAVYALGNIIESKRDLATTEVKEQMLNLFKNRNSSVRAAAVYTLSQLISANPDLLSKELAESIFTVLTTDNTWVISQAAPTLEIMLQLAGELVDPEWTQPLVIAALDPTSNYFGDNAHPLAPILERLLAISPTAGNDVIEALVEEIQKDDFDDGPFGYRQNSGLKCIARLLAHDQTSGEQLATKLLALIIDEDFSRQDIAFFLLHQMIVVNPSLVTREMATATIQFLSKEKSTWGIRDATVLLGTIIAIDPSIKTTELVELLMDRFETSDTYEKAVYLNELRKVLVVDPAVGSASLTKAIQDLLVAEDADLRELATATLAAIYSQQALETRNTESLFGKLYESIEPKERSAAARALFYVAVKNPDQGALLLQQLKKDGGSQEPLVRLWANRTRQMIELLPQITSTANQPPTVDKLKEVLEFGLNLRCTIYVDDSYKANQHYQINFDNEYDYSMYYFSHQRPISPPFFGQDFAWAAWQVLYWLNQQPKAEIRQLEPSFNRSSPQSGLCQE